MKKENLLFNPKGSDELEDRKLLGGNSTNLFNLNNVKYKWANKIYQKMLEDFWIPQKVDLSNDITDYKKLPSDEQRTYDGILSFLVFLDSIQTNNLPNIADYITAPEVKLALMTQTFQEGLHSKSYAYLIETAIPVSQRKKIYEFWKKDKVLFNRNKYIASIYQDFIEESSEDQFARALVADYLLEGVYFYNGFNFFYNLAARNLMTGTKDMIKYIHRDELQHCALFMNLINDLKREEPNLIKKEMVYDMFEKAVEFELEWSQHIIGNNILGMDQNAIKDHTHWLANMRLKNIGFEAIFPDVKKNPFAHLNKIADLGSKADSKGNFFETTVTSYNQSSIISGWNKIDKIKSQQN